MGGEYRVPRRGRPPISAPEPDAQHETGNKRLRMRMAQRAYRSKKEKALESERARSEKLSKALQEALSTFGGFHRQVMQLPGSQTSPALLAHLNMAITKMTDIANSVDNDASLPLSHASSSSIHQPRPQPPHFDSTESRSINAASQVVALSLRTSDSGPNSLAQRLFRACLERAVTILSSGVGYQSRFPALALPLQLLGEELVLIDSLRTLSLFNITVADFQYVQYSGRLPRMYRLVEGQDRAVPRLAAPWVQQIVRGRTRTRLVTNVAPLQGEWLEAADVEEYLEERGIYLRGADRNGVTTPVTHGHLIDTLNSGQRNTMDNRQIFPLDNISESSSTAIYPVLSNDQGQQPPNTTQTVPREDTAFDSRAHESSDWSIFGLPAPQPPRGVVSIEIPDISWQPPSQSAQSGPQPPSSGEQISIDLDHLVQSLAANAICLGPGPGIRKASVDSCIRDSVTV